MSSTAMSPAILIIIAFSIVTISVIVSVVVSKEILPITGPTGPIGPTGSVGMQGIQGMQGMQGMPGRNASDIYYTEVYSGLTLCGISPTGALITTSENVPGFLTKSPTGANQLTPFKIEKGGIVEMIAITATLDPSTTSYNTGSNWQFYLGSTYGAYDIMSQNGWLGFPGKSNTPQTFYFTPGSDGLPNKIVLNPGSTLAIKGVQLSGILNNVTLGFVFRKPPEFWNKS